jgi:prevent-host-death family protein
MNLKASEDLRPMSDLKSKAAEIVGHVQETGRPVVLTRHGRGVAVLLAIADYEALQERVDRFELQRAVNDAERDIAEGRVISHEAMETKLRRRIDGKATK